MQKKRLVSVILSFRNEKEVIPELLRRLQGVFKSFPVDYELIFVNDASTDDSLPILIEKSKEDKRVKIVNMSRRFGVSECVFAGMRYAVGDAVVYMDADLQDPPEVIPELIDKWQEGADVVHTVRNKREGESALKLTLTYTAYRIIGAFSDVPLMLEAGDFKLLSRRAVNELLQLQEKTPYLRGLVNWVGFSQVTVSYKREARTAGVTKFPLFRNIFHDFANLRGPVGTLVIGLTSFSLFPIMVFLMAGLLVCLGSFFALLIFTGLLLSRFSLSWWPGLAIIAVFMLSGVQLLGIGTLGVYLGRIYQDVRGRPRYIVESTIGFEEDV